MCRRRRREIKGKIMRRRERKGKRRTFVEGGEEREGMKKEEEKE